ncbi:MAG: TonB-dependent receptor [Bacteroidales bacterium]|nr:TonB-dependent receptor [Bacteroidales bacterium]
MGKKLWLFLACMLMSASMAFAQSQISGSVLDAETGEPLIGVTVRVPGTNVGAITNADGKFSVNLPAGKKNLSFSYMGMTTVQVAARSGMVVRMEPDAKAMDALVVMGYGSQKKLGTIAGSVETVSADKFEHKPVANIGDALQGQVAGLQVFTSSGEPSASVSMRIRGVTSINASTTPLYVLDGSEITSSAFTMLNPNDIESMTVLKDASATAIYGSRAANGVVILTSKQGKRGQKGTVTVSAQYGISKMTGDHTEMMNSEQWLTLQEMISPSNKTNANFQAMKNYYVKNGISTDWKDVFFGGSSPTAEINLSATGGSEALSYLMSYGHYQAEGIMDDSRIRRETFRVNLTATITDWLKVGANTNLAYRKYGTTAFGNSSNSVYNKVYASRIYLPIETYHDIIGLDRSDYANSTFQGYGARKDYFDLLGYYNPYYLSEIQPSHNDQTMINENAYVNINPVKGLNLRSAVGLQWYDYRYTYVCQPVGPFEPRYKNGQLIDGGSRTESFNRYYNWTVTNTAEYKFDINQEHMFTILAGQESMSNKDQSFRARSEFMTDQRLMLLDAASDGLLPTQSISEEARNSWFGMLNYSYLDKYFVDLSVRRDGSSLFGQNKRWATFGAAAAMWKISSEKFMEPTKGWLKDLSLKASFGSTGNSGIAPYLALGLVVPGPRYDGNSGTASANPANPDLSWEKVKTTNVGLSGNICNILDFNIEFYNKVTSDMLMEIPYSYTTGFSSGYGNVATMRNRGVDFDLNARIIRTKDWQWSVRLNGNYNKNIITDLFQGLDSYVLGETGMRLEKGKPYGEFYYVRYVGVDPIDGQNIWLDKNGNKTKVYSEDDKVMTGKQMFAPWSGGLSTSLSWKGLTLDVQFTGMFGRYMINNERYFTENGTFASENNQTTNMLRMWTTPGQVTDIPAADADIEFDTHLLEKANFVRLKTLQLSYTFPKRLMAATGFIKDAKIYMIGRNLLTFTPYTGYDPEVDSNITLGNYPNTRQVSIGAQLTF